MGLVVGKNEQRIIESCEIGRASKPGFIPMTAKSEIQNLPDHTENDVSVEAKAESGNTSAAENVSNSDSSPVISRDSYGAMMKARFDRDLKKFAGQKGYKT